MRKIRLVPLIGLLFVAGAVLLPSEGPVSVLAENETHYVFLGDKVTVGERKLAHDGETKTVMGEIIAPDGSTFKGREFTAKQHGRYRVRYRAYFGYDEVEKTIDYVCQRRGLDYFSYDDGTKGSFQEFRYNTARYSHSGVAFDIKSGSEIRFNEPLDMDDFMTPQHIDPGKDFRDMSSVATAASLIDFIVDPTAPYSPDFTGLQFTLTDVEDENNYVEIRLEDAGESDEPSKTASRARIGFPGGFLAGWEAPWGNHPGHFHYTSSGTGLAMSFRGKPYQEQLHSGQFLFDYGNRRFYTYPGSLSHSQVFFINDLDDPEIYTTNTWKGFPSGKCYLTIKPYNFAASSARLLIKSVGKYDLSSEILADTIAPNIEVDFKGHPRADLPKAILNQPYPLFSYRVMDNYDVAPLSDVSVSYRDVDAAKNVDVSIENNAFVPKRAGTYTITYSASDLTGNAATPVALRVETVSSVPAISVTHDPSTGSVKVLSPITIPNASELTISGGNGRVDVERTVYGPNDEVVAVVGDELIPEKIGTYRVHYEASDYTGNRGTYDFTVTAAPLSAPKFITRANIPPVMIKGFHYSLNNLEAVEAINGELVPVESQVLINGVAQTGLFVATGEELSVEFVAQGSTGVAREQHAIPVIDGNDPTYTLNQAAYFYGNLNATMNEDDILLSSDSDGEVTFANRLDMTDFYILFERIDVNFSTLVLRFTDADDTSIQATARINLDAETISLPGVADVAFGFFENEISLSYLNVSKNVLDTGKKAVGAFLFDDEGNPFKGFAHGAYVTVGFEGVTGESSLKMVKINNQTLGYKDGTGDRLEPTIRLDEGHVSEQKLGARFVYPTFEAYDVFSEIESTEIRIIRPGDTPLVGDNHMTESFDIKNYGQYTIMYEATDTAGNIQEFSKVVNVFDDVKPALTVKPLSKTRYSVGEAVDVPTYSVSDNLGSYVVDVILILPSNEMRILTHDENGNITYALVDNTLYLPSFIKDQHSFKTEQKGKHILRYVAYDSQFNKTTVELEFTVR